MFQILDPTRGKGCLTISVNIATCTDWLLFNQLQLARDWPRRSSRGVQGFIILI
jgi:hypothetical protein